MRKQQSDTPAGLSWNSGELSLVDTPLRALQAQITEIPNVFTAAECSRISGQAETVGLSAQKYNDASRAQPRARTNLSDESLVKTIWTRICDRVPPLEQIYARHSPSQPPSDVSHADYAPVGVNPFLRVYRYDVGTRFPPHEDTPYIAPDGQRSFLTVLLYLNDEFSGGETIFYVDHKDSTVGSIAIHPKAGAVVIFPHELWHEGTEITAGWKYVMRTEVMYARK